MIKSEFQRKTIKYEYWKENSIYGSIEELEQAKRIHFPQATHWYCNSIETFHFRLSSLLLRLYFFYCWDFVCQLLCEKEYSRASRRYESIEKETFFIGFAFGCRWLQTILWFSFHCVFVFVCLKCSKLKGDKMTNFVESKKVKENQQRFQHSVGWLQLSVEE